MEGVPKTGWPLTNTFIGAAADAAGAIIINSNINTVIHHFNFILSTAFWVFYSPYFPQAAPFLAKLF
jgi:hypothetical protein